MLSRRDGRDKKFKALAFKSPLPGEREVWGSRWNPIYRDTLDVGVTGIRFRVTSYFFQ
jgi:hypothetical protein